MSSDAATSGDNGKPRKPRRNFNRNKQRPRGKAVTAPAATAPTPAPAPAKPKPKTKPSPKPKVKPAPVVAKDARPARPASRPRREPSPSPENKPEGEQGGGGGGRKPRKVRTKNCVHCYTPNAVLHKVRLSQKSQWSYICDICWPTRCLDNPSYVYGGTWTTGRLHIPGEKKPKAVGKAGSNHGPKRPRSPRPQRDGGGA